jgi:hypothetical protein
MYVCIHVVYEMYNIKEMSFIGVFAYNVDLYKLPCWWWLFHIAKIVCDHELNRRQEQQRNMDDVS